MRKLRVFTFRFSKNPLKALSWSSKYHYSIRNHFLHVWSNFQLTWIKNIHFMKRWPSLLAYHASKYEFSQYRKGTKKKWSVAFWDMVWRVEWDKIFDSIAHVGRLDTFTRSTSTGYTLLDSKLRHQSIFQSEISLRTVLYTVYVAESEKIIFRS